MQFFLVACTLLIIYFYMGCSHVMIIRDITYIKRKIISPFDISSCKLGITNPTPLKKNLVLEI
jgi:uncharacterized membrane protein